ncbi:MAG: SCP2 sterol-binding domain-containing protein [Clostridiales bacterium]|nr:SCP2 sterol-binding domain-containing protein [Clostridiales bacterium]
MTYESLVNTVRNKFKGADVSSVSGTLAYQFNVTGKAEGIFYVEIKDGSVNVEPYEYYDRNAIITINGTNLIKLINGKLDPVLAFTTGKLKVDGDVNAALQLIKFIK